MRPDFLDRYSRLRSPIHRLPAWVKLLAALLLIGTLISVPVGWWTAYAAAGAFLVAIAVLSGVPWLFLLRRVILLEPFVLGVSLLALIQPDGWRLFAAIVTRGTLCLLTMVLLANTTPFSAILGVLQRIRTPALLVTTIALMYRYIFILVDEAARMRRARLSRTFVRGRWRLWRSLSTIIGQLFIRGSERAERIYAAMCARGWR